VRTEPVASDDGGTSPLLVIVPNLVLVAMLGMAVACARMPRRSPA